MWEPESNIKLKTRVDLQLWKTWIIIIIIIIIIIWISLGLGKMTENIKIKPQRV